MYRILIVEDDALIASEIKKSLERWGLSAHTVSDFSDVMGEFARVEPQLVIMDISLPFYNGYHWCSLIRQSSKVPVMFLSSRSEDMDIVMAVNMGGDDYIAKPVAMEVLIAKVRSLLRRAYDYELAAPMFIRGAAFDPVALTLVKDGVRTELTRNEARLLGLLLSSRGAPVSREALMLALWDSAEFVDDNTLTVNVNRLRKTLEGAGLGEGCIATVKGEGYRIAE